MSMSEDEALNRAIEESLKDIPKAEPKQQVHHIEEKVSEPAIQERKVDLGDGKPKDPPPNPPMPGMTLKTVIKNGWVTKEWRMF
jgi:hypothetical protein